MNVMYVLDSGTGQLRRLETSDLAGTGGGGSSGGLTDAQLRAQPIQTDARPGKVLVFKTGGVTYVCEASSVSAATSAAVWRIRRITVTGEDVAIQFAGTGAFDQIADNRASVVYQ